MRKLPLILLGFSAFSAYGACSLSSPDKVLERIKNNHPRIALNKMQGKVIEKEIAIAGQAPNIEFEAETSYGKTDTESSTDSSISLIQNFEIGGKRSKRVNVAYEQFKKAQYDFSQDDENAISDAVLKLYTLRQNIELIPLYEESVVAFNNILKGLKKNRILSPEQQVEKETLELALNSYKLKISQLSSEKMRLEKELALMMGDTCKLTLGNLPHNVSNLTMSKGKESSKLKAAKQSVAVANSVLVHEKALAIPDIQFGPKFGIEQGEAEDKYSVGLAFSMELPFSNRNQGGRAKALEQVRFASKKLEYLRQEQAISVQTWIARYDRYQGLLSTIASKDQLRKKHKRIEKLFKRGMISTSLVIESHRQLIDYSSTRFEYELGAVEALWNIYKLQGTIKDAELGGKRES